MSAFTVHGIWTPGVMLMRGISFKVKALIISLIFLMPVALSSTFLITTQRSQIAFSQAERDGVAYLKALNPVTEQLHRMRRATVQQIASLKPQPELASARSALSERLAELSQAQAQWGASLRTQAPLAALQQAIDGLPSSTERLTVEAALRQYESAIGAVSVLTSVVLDNSNLTLDPDIDSYFSMDAIGVRLPLLIDMTGVIRELVASAALGLEPTRGLERRAPAAQALGDFNDAALQDGLKKVLALRPAMASGLDVSAPTQAMRRLFEMSASLGEGSNPGLEAVLREGDAAIDGF